MKRSRLLPDFVFLDDDGSTHALRDVLGDFTVLAVTPCDKTTHGPATELLVAMVAENRGVNHLDVRGIDIHWSDARCEQHDACHLVDVQAHTLILCDATSAIRRLYGVGQEGCFYVIGPDCHVIDSAPANDVARLALQLSLDVALCTDGMAKTRPPGLGPRCSTHLCLCCGTLGWSDGLMDGLRVVKRVKDGLRWWFPGCWMR